PAAPAETRAAGADRAALRLAATAGFLVTDRNGKKVGRVESPMYGTAPDEPDALAVKAGLFQRSLVMADTIDSIDEATGVIVLSCERNATPPFLKRSTTSTRREAVRDETPRAARERGARSRAPASA